jgi:S1-C subfamily serine protease
VDKIRREVAAMKIVITAIASVIALCACATTARQIPQSLTLPQAIEQMRPSIVQIRVQAVGLSEELQRKLGPPFIVWTIGTGFLVNDAHVITAHHVIEGGRRLLAQIDATRKYLAVGFPTPNTERRRGNFESFDVEVVAEDPANDLALVRLHEGLDVIQKRTQMPIRAARLIADRPREGTAAAVSGYPLGSAVLVTNAGSMATAWSSDVKELIEPSVAPLVIRQQVDVYLADIVANRGNSGGPVFATETAGVIGVCVAGRTTAVVDQHDRPVRIPDESGKMRELRTAAGLTIVVPAAHVIDLLKRHRLRWEEIR